MTDSSQSSDQTVTEPSQSQTAKKARKPRAVRVPVGHKLDTGVGPDDGHRYRRIRDAVIAGQVKPSVRVIQATEGGGTEIVRAYLQQLEREGIVARMGRGYRLVARPNTVPGQGELL